MSKEYDPSKYIPDTKRPDLQCPICDYEDAKDTKDLEFHLLREHDEHMLCYTIGNLVAHNWRMEQIIRKLTGKQSYEVEL